MKCGNCGYDIPPVNALFCPRCGAKTGFTEDKTQAAQEICPDISSVWPEWTLVTLLGKGSYGSVYKAVRKDSGIETEAAIKIISVPSDKTEIDSLRSDGYDDKSTKDYFREMVDDVVEEIRLMISFKGIQNIVSVEDFRVVEKEDEIGWNIYIRMELLTPFNSYISDKRLSERDVIKFGIDIATALELCARKDVIHRDIKPENIFINDFGYYKLGDFGIARKLENKTAGLSAKGTPNYMAPEVAHSEKYDTRADIYSLGIVLYRLLNDNKLPFLPEGKQIFSHIERKEAIEKRLNGEAMPAPCRASAPMAHLVLKACEYRCENRFSSATELKNALIQVLEGKYSAHLKKTDAADETVRARAGQKPPVNTGGNPYGFDEKKPVPRTQDGSIARHPAGSSAENIRKNTPGNNPPEGRGKSYVTVIAIAVALGLLTGILVGGIILLMKSSSGGFSLNINSVNEIFISAVNEIYGKLLFLD